MSEPGGGSAVVVIDVPEASRFEARIGDALVGFVEYRLLTARITFIHTEVLPGSEGRGVGSTLARTVLAPTQLPVGVLTAFICVPTFLWLLLRHARRA